MSYDILFSNVSLDIHWHPYSMAIASRQLAATQAALGQYRARLTRAEDDLGHAVRNKSRLQRERVTMAREVATLREAAADGERKRYGHGTFAACHVFERITKPRLLRLKISSDAASNICLALGSPRHSKHAGPSFFYSDGIL
jgi:hypothetical protein